jgi:cell division protein FtsB
MNNAALEQLAAENHRLKEEVATLRQMGARQEYRIKHLVRALEAAQQ